MAKRGRPSTPGKRHPNGRKVHTPKAKDPTSKVMEAKRRFGTYYCSALGRFYASGLMGKDDLAKDRYQGALRFLRIYGSVYGGPYFRSPLDQTPRGKGHERENPFAEQDREWLRTAMAALDVSGCYPYLEQLLCLTNVDSGPGWLDRMLDVQLWNSELASLNNQLREKAKATGNAFAPQWPKAMDPRDQMIADAAIKALDILAPARRQSQIMSETYEDAA